MRVDTFSVFASFTLLVAVFPLTLIANAATAPAVENLQNGSLEGAPGASNGYELKYAAQPAAVARTGQQSVDLGPAGSTPQPWSALALVAAYPNAPVPLSQLQDISFYYSVPATPGASVQFQTFLSLSTTGSAPRDTCLIGAPGANLAQTSGFVQLDIPLSTSFLVAPGDCSASGSTRTLAALQADPAYANAALLTMYVQTLTTASTYPAASSIFVDDLSIRASSSPNVRILPASTNLCNGASFADIKTALACADTGATILVAPGTYAGDITIPGGVTVCSTPVGETACHPQPTTTFIHGVGCYPVQIYADSVTLQGFTIENPGCTQADQDFGAFDPTLVTVYGNGVSILDSVLQTIGSTLKPGQSRQYAQAIYFDPAHSGGVVDGVTIQNLGSAKGPDGTCLNAPCRVTGIFAQPGLTIADTTIDGASVSAPFTAVRAADGLLLKDATLRLPTGTATGAPDSLGVAGAGNGVHLLRVSVAPAQGAAPGTAYGFFAATGAASVADSTFDQLNQGVFFRSGAPGNSVTGSTFTKGAVGVTSYSTLTTISGNSFDTFVNAIVLNDTVTGDALHANTFRNAQTALDLLTGVHGAAIDATRNDWGKYTKTEIQALVKDQGTGNSVDVSCYLLADHSTQVCPPHVDFGLPANPHFGRSLLFSDMSVSRGNPIASWAWSFSDGGTSTARNAGHIFGAPGAYTVTLTATDTDGQSASLTKSLGVTDTAPTLAHIPDTTVAEGAHLTVVVSATDPDADGLIFSASGLPAGALFQGRTLSWTPSFAQAGVYPVDITVNDGAMTATQTFTITVTDVPMPPTLSPISAVTMVETGAKDVALRASDPDGTPIVFSLAIDAPAFASITDNGDGTAVLHLAPGLGTKGAYSVGVVATSDGQDATRSLALTVLQKSSFTIGVVGSSAVAASGGKIVTLTARVTNTGPETDTFTLLPRSNNGWALAQPASPITLAAGVAQLVTFTVTAPALGGTDGVTLSGASVGNPTVKTGASWTVDATLRASVLMLQRTLTLLQTPHGTFTLAWADGTGVVGAAVTATQNPDQGLGLLASSVSGTTGSDGTFAYSFGTDPLARLPGLHTLTLVGKIGPLQATTDVLYQVSVT